MARLIFLHDIDVDFLKEYSEIIKEKKYSILSFSDFNKLREKKAVFTGSDIFILTKKYECSDSFLRDIIRCVISYKSFICTNIESLISLGVNIGLNLAKKIKKDLKYPSPLTVDLYVNDSKVESAKLIKPVDYILNNDLLYLLYGSRRDFKKSSKRFSESLILENRFYHDISTHDKTKEIVEIYRNSEKFLSYNYLITCIDVKNPHVVKYIRNLLEK